MVTTKEGPSRPYAPPANVVAVLQRLRRMNMPGRLSREFYGATGISGNLIPRVSSTLRFLELITENHEPTDTLRALSTSTEEEYRKILENTIRTAYAEDFEVVNPEEDTQDRILNAFQRYTPKSQHLRQVILLLGLCKEAGMEIKDIPRGRGMQTGTSRPKKSKIATKMRKDKVDTQGEIEAGEEKRYRTGEQLLEQFLGITLEDAAFMPEKEFRQVWDALGTVFRLRGQRLYLQPAFHEHTERDDTSWQLEEESAEQDLSPEDIPF